MTTISRATSAYSVPVRATERRGGGAGIVNPVAAVTPDRRPEPADWRSRKKTMRGAASDVPPASYLLANGQVLASLHAVGAEERRRTQPGAYEAVSRYEDRYFGIAETGLIRKASA